VIREKFTGISAVSADAVFTGTGPSDTFYTTDRGLVARTSLIGEVTL